jgi:hypothetical protein
MNPGIILILVAGAIFYFDKNKSASALPQSALTTDQKRAAIIAYWQQVTSPINLSNDNGRFEDIINNITGNEIDTIYIYVYSYLVKGTKPAPGTSLYNEISAIINQYNIFQ